MSEKIIGYSLLAVGIFLMIGPTASVLLVFTHVTTPIQLFAFSGISLDLGQLVAANLPTGLTVPTVETEIIPAAMLNESANLFAHVFLMGFILNLGYKLASLGIALLRPIQVTSK